MKIEAQRLVIADFTLDMAQAVHLNSLDEDNRRFVPDEVFETVEDASDTLTYLIERYQSEDGPFVHPILLKDETVIGHVQAILLGDTWEIGYHVGKQFTGHGYATEALQAFLPEMARTLQLKEIWGICLADNTASARVMQKCGFEKVFEGNGDYQGKQRRICKFVYRC